MEYIVGATLYFVPSGRYRAAEQVVVKSVGRKWVKLSNGERVEIGETRVDGGDYNSPGSLYASQEAYEAYEALSVAWDALRRRIDKSYAPPNGLTPEKMVQVEQLIFGGNNDDGM